MTCFVSSPQPVRAVERETKVRHMTKAMSRARRWGTFLLALALSGASIVAGCVPLERAGDTLDDADVDALKEQGLAILRALFPDLSSDELAAIRGDLTIEEIIALKDELEAVRKKAAEFSDALFTSAGESASERQEELETQNDGFPAGLEPVGRVCTYDDRRGRGEVRLSGVFDGEATVMLTSDQVQLTINGVDQPFSFRCMQEGTVDIIFLIDITGSMSNVIHSVRDSVVSFIDALEASGIRGTLGIVTFQDSVGVNRTFQEPAPALGYERSPFFAPVALDDAAAVENVRAFVNRLEANAGADAPENLAGAVDFARNSVIGYTVSGAPNVIGDGREDPTGTSAFPKLRISAIVDA